LDDGKGLAMGGAGSLLCRAKLEIGGTGFGEFNLKINFE
jgi:hypothetical protein